MAETISGSLKTCTASEVDSDWFNLFFSSVDFSSLTSRGWNEVIPLQNRVSFSILSNSGLSGVGVNHSSTSVNLEYALRNAKALCSHPVPWGSGVHGLMNSNFRSDVIRHRRWRSIHSRRETAENRSTLARGLLLLVLPNRRCNTSDQSRILTSLTPRSDQPWPPVSRDVYRFGFGESSR